MKLYITKDFTFWHKGYEPVNYIAGSEVETDDQEFAEVSLREGWADSPTEKADKPVANKARKSAPENKSE